jgi:phosphate transport system protein
MPPAPLPSQLAQLCELLGTMCAGTASALQYATAALLQGRDRLAEQVITRHPDIQRMRAEAEEIATDALLFHQPVAGDLRAVVAAIRTAGDIERMGALARHVAQVAVRGRTLPAEVHEDFARMGEVAVGLGRKAAEVVRTRNVLLAVELDADDDAMDELHLHMFEVLMDPGWRHGIPAAVDVTLLARYYERFADHAVTIAHATVYAVTGRADAPVSAEPCSNTAQHSRGVS